MEQGIGTSEKADYSAVFIALETADNIWDVGNNASDCQAGLVQDADFAGDVTDSK